MNSSKEKLVCKGKKGKGKIANSLILWSGIVLITAAAVITGLWVYGELSSLGKAEEIASELELLMPDIKSGSYDDRINTSQPMAEVDSESFIGILDIPAYGVKLPVGASWDEGKLREYPCRYTGSIYSGGLAIGGKNGAGQFNFTDKITVYDRVSFTDVMGNRYAFEVSEIIIADEVTHSVCDGADLVLFAQSGHTDGYVLIKCKK